MKKLVLMLTALLTISLSACSQSNKRENKDMKVLVAYFSASGVTRALPCNWQRWQVPTCMRLDRHSPIQMLTSTGATSRAVAVLRCRTRVLAQPSPQNFRT